ncbi:MAG: hypothetical protein ACK4FR_08110 [Tabrizicola sp.]
MGAGLGGLLGALALALVLPLLLLVFVGWWIGKRIAFKTLSLRGTATALTVICLIPFIFWYPSLGLPTGTGPEPYVSPGSEVFSQDLFGYLMGYWNVLVFALFPVGIAAAISWVLNLDDAVSQRSSEESK